MLGSAGGGKTFTSFAEFYSNMTSSLKKSESKGFTINVLLY